MTETRKGINIGYFLLGIIFLLVSLLAFRNPTGSLLSIIIYFGVTFIMKGIWELFFHNSFKKLIGKGSFWLILVSLADIIIGTLLIAKIGISLAVLPYVFAIMFIMDSIASIFASTLVKEVNKGSYYFSIILNVLGIFAGIYLLINPLTSALTLAFIVGFYFMTTGINYILAAFNLL